MLTTVRYLSYSLADASGNPVWQVDFSSPKVSVPETHMQQFLLDLGGIRLANVTSSWISTLELKADGLLFKVVRDYVTGKAQILDASGNPTTELDLEAEAWSGNQVQISSSEIELVQQILRDEDMTGKADPIVQLQAQLQDLIPEIAPKLIEAEQKITEIEEELQRQRDADEAAMTIKELQVAEQELQDKLGSVQGLMEAKQNVEMQLTSLQASMGLKDPSDIQQHKQERLQQRDIDLQKLRSSADLRVANESGRVAGRAGLWMLPTSGSLLLIGLASYALLQSWLALVIALLGSLMLIVTFWWINKIPQEPELTSSRSGVVGADTESPGNSVETAVPNAQDSAFINKAWYEVLAIEHSNILNAIREKAAGADATELNKGLAQVQQELQKLRLLVEEQRQHEIAPEDYLKKRRELDLQKIEKARLEAEIRGSEKYEEVERVRSKLGLVQTGLNTKGELRIDSKELAKILGAQDLRLNGETIEIQRQDAWSALELDEGVAASLHLMLSIYRWSREAVYPLMVIGFWDRISVAAQQHIDAKMVQLAPVGQIIILTA